MGTRSFVACCASALVQFVITSPSPAATPEQVARLVREIKPTPSELKWQQIPWLLDLSEGLRQARLEARPLLLWGSDDDPLERC